MDVVVAVTVGHVRMSVTVELPPRSRMRSSIAVLRGT